MREQVARVQAQVEELQRQRQNCQPAIDAHERAELLVKTLMQQYEREDEDAQRYGRRPPSKRALDDAELSERALRGSAQAALRAQARIDEEQAPIKVELGRLGVALELERWRAVPSALAAEFAVGEEYRNCLERVVGRIRGVAQYASEIAHREANGRDPSQHAAMAISAQLRQMSEVLAEKAPCTSQLFCLKPAQNALRQSWAQCTWVMNVPQLVSCPRGNSVGSGMYSLAM